jgi:hypothetical protein
MAGATRNEKPAEIEQLARNLRKIAPNFAKVAEQ